MIYLTGTGTLPTALVELAGVGPVVLVDEQVRGFDLPAVVGDSRQPAREMGAEAATRLLDLRAKEEPDAVPPGPAVLSTSVAIRESVEPPAGASR